MIRTVAFVLIAAVLPAQQATQPERQDAQPAQRGTRPAQRETQPAQQETQPAQQGAAPRILELAVAGPAAWRLRLGPTMVGTMMASAQGEALWRRYAAVVEAALQRAVGDPALFARERSQLLAYDGEVHLVVWLDQAEDALHVPRWSAALVMTPDGHTDLAALADDVGAWLRGLGERAERPWLDLRLTPPRLVGDRLVAVLANAEDLAAATARAAALVPEPLDRRQVLRMRVQLQDGLGILRDRPTERCFAAALLGTATESATVTIGCEGPRLSGGVEVQFGEGDRGLLAAIMPPLRGAPALDWLLPDDVPTSYACRVDAKAAWGAWCAIVGAWSERDADKVRARVAESNGFDVGDDVLSLLADRALLLEGGDDASAAGSPMAADTCLVMPVRDPAFAGMLDKWLQECGVIVTKADDGVQWAELGGDVKLACGFGVVCVGGGQRGLAWIDDVLERAAKRPVGDAAAREGGDCGVGSLDVSKFLTADLPGGALLLWSLADSAPPSVSFAELAEEMARWRPLLRTIGLDRAQLRATADAGAWALRVLW